MSQKSSCKSNQTISSADVTCSLSSPVLFHSVVGFSFGRLSGSQAHTPTLQERNIIPLSLPYKDWLMIFSSHLSVLFAFTTGRRRGTSKNCGTVF